MKYKIVLKQDDGDCVILHDHLTEESAFYMMNWYKVHQKFFNGKFEIREMD